MDNLAYAATTSNSALEQLTMNNKKLVDQVSEAMTLLKKAQEDNTKLLKIIEASLMKGPVAATSGGGYRRGKGKNQREEFKKTDHLMEPEGYCWTCGYQVTKNHSSMNCDSRNRGISWGQPEPTPWEVLTVTIGGNHRSDGANK